MTTFKSGILFEDTGDTLEWNSSLDQLARRIKSKRVNSAGRITYDWGLHSILNGLSLNLSTTVYEVSLANDFGTFKSIEFWAIGDQDAERYLRIILIHLKKQFGLPTWEKKNGPDETYEWVIEDVAIKLYFFEQHAYKLHLTLSKNNGN